MITLKSDREIELMREAGKIVALAIEEIRKAVAPGITTKELDAIAESFIRQCGAKPAFKGYNGFPASICASINEEVVHGIPGLRKLKNGDIISVDVGSEINGYFGDAAITLPVGEIDPRLADLLKVTEASLYQGIKEAHLANRLSDISHAVQKYVEDNGFSVVRQYVGHGIGSAMHEEPQVPNFGKPGRGPRLQKGMALAIEPMVNMGNYEVYSKEDKWTVVTKDNLPSAHFEHTIVILEDGPEIMTRL